LIMIVAFVVFVLLRAFLVPRRRGTRREDDR
jgi:hypothetical protein